MSVPVVVGLFASPRDLLIECVSRPVASSSHWQLTEQREDMERHFETCGNETFIDY